MSDKTQQITKRSERLKQLKEYFLNNFVEDGTDGTRFDDDIINAIKALEEKYRDPDIKRIIGTHAGGCGGNIIAKDQCRWCDKCKEYFCGCACG